ncbi:hypothetical protein GCM10023187_00630 [Nibrella viscosa]|uniref:Zincin peptidase n=1 Tax=Nibrella viscosa TaxID=1084524 RepID=A0ABP8JQU5_9BACT
MAETAVPNPDTLPEQGYQLLESVSFEQSLPFFQAYLRRWNLVTITYTGLNVLILGAVGAWVGVSLAHQKAELSSHILAFFVGIGLTFLLIPVHELLHALAYRIAGAQRIRYAVEWRKLMFLTIADGFVIRPKPFCWVILTPFLVLTTLAVLGLVVGSPGLQFSCLGFLLIHTGACSGDCALLSFLYEHRHRSIRSYDDALNRMSYFYAKV